MDKLIFIKFAFYIILIGVIITILLSQKNREKLLLKISIVTGLLLVAVIMAFGLYFLSYNIVNKIGIEVYNSYAAEGKFEKNVYFSEEIDDKTKIDSTIMEIVNKTKDDDKTSKKILEKLSQKDKLNNDDISIQELLGVVAKNKVISEECINNNSQYVDYLKQKNLRVSDFINYCEKIYELDNNIQRGCFYLSFTLIVSIILFKFKYRKGTYGWSALIYILIILNDFTKGLLGQAIYHVKIVMSNLSADDFNTLTTLLMPALKEAFLTVIILDGIYQYNVQKKSEVELNKKIIDIEISINGAVDNKIDNVYRKINFINNKLEKVKKQENKRGKE